MTWPSTPPRPYVVDESNQYEIDSNGEVWVKRHRLGHVDSPAVRGLADDDSDLGELVAEHDRVDDREALRREAEFTRRTA